MRIELSCARIGVRADQLLALKFGRRYGFNAVEPHTGEISTATDSSFARLVERWRASGLRCGSATLPVEFRRDATSFRAGLAQLPALAKRLVALGASGAGTYLPCASDTLDYPQQFALLRERIAAMADIFGEHGLKLGFKYIGATSARRRGRFPFVHTLGQTMELIQAVDRPNVGLVLDCWHWHVAGDNDRILRNLDPERILTVELADALPNVPLTRQSMFRRALPGSTGEIATEGFLQALSDIGYRGAVRADVFQVELWSAPPEVAVKRVAQSLRQVLGGRHMDFEEERCAEGSRPGLFQ